MLPFARSKFWRSPWAPRAVGLAICLAVFATIAVLRAYGQLQLLELKAYDLLVRGRAKDTSYSNRIVLVGMTELDIARLGFPITDADLARSVELILKGNARAVGIDIFRDKPVPNPA